MKNIEEFDELVDLAYATAVDPANYDDFMSAWDHFLGDHIHHTDNNRSVKVEDSVLQVHFDRAQKILGKLGRTKPENSQAIELVSKCSGEGIILEIDGRLRAANRLAQDNLNTEGKSDIYETELSQSLCEDLLKWAKDVTQPPYYFARDKDQYSTSSKGYFAVRLNLDTPPEDSIIATETKSQSILLQSTALRLTEQTSNLLQEMFSLSNAEIEIARQLVDGLSPKEISHSRNASINTIRTQIKSLLEKADAKNIVDMVRMFCGYSASHSTGRVLSRVELKARSKPLSRTSCITLPNGRKLGVIEHGDPQGRPVLFFHSMLYGVALPSTFASACKRRGWRIIAPSRPGYGNSDADLKATGSTLMNVTADDFKYLLQYLGLSKAHLIGHLMGSIFAQRFAARHPEFCKSLNLISSVPYWERKFINDLPARQKLIAQTTRFAPFALPYVTRAGVALIDAGRQDKFLDALSDGIPSDEKACRRPDVRTAIRTGLTHCVAQGSYAFGEDCKIILKDWSKDSTKLQTRTSVFVGENQQFPPMPHIQGYLDIHKAAKLISIKGAGTHLLYSHWQHVLRFLEDIDA